MDEFLRSFPVAVEIPVAWGEMDAFRHVNNVVYFQYFESARMACFENLKLQAVMDTSGVGPILASTQCRFRAALTYPDTVVVGTRIDDLQEDRFIMKYAVFSHRLQKIAAEGEGLIIFFDYRENRKASIPSEIRQLILNDAYDQTNEW